MTQALPLPLPRAGATRVIRPDDVAQRLERARILLSGCCEALIEVEHLAPGAGELVNELDRALPRLRALVDRYDEPELPAR